MDDRGEDWSDASICHETPVTASQHQELGESRKIPPPGFRQSMVLPKL